MDLSLDQVDFKKISINSMIGGFKPNTNKNIKWKSYGLKSYVPYKLDYDDNFIFFAVGMSEYLLFELLEVNYILLQSDSMYRYISLELINKVREKQIIVFK